MWSSSNHLTLLFFIPLVLGCLLITLLFLGESIRRYIERVRRFKYLRQRMTNWSKRPSAVKKELPEDTEYLMHETKIVGNQVLSLTHEEKKEDF